MTEVIAIIIAYLLGTIPTAYIVTRLWAGRDIRKLGGGNVGFMNVFREVGIAPALVVILIDIGKGASAVAIAKWGLGTTDTFVLLAGLASIIGHNWMPWLKFTGGKGMASAIGIIITLFLAYGYPLQLGIFIAIVLIPLFITCNVAFSMALGLIALPFIVWFGTHSAFAASMAAVLFLISFIKFLPTAILAMKKSRRKKDFVFDTFKGKDKEEK
ncbi:MAG: glycerol-3-phosphate acyltransferase [Dehalococcoidales bacterium]|nr:glycerol-3-phosphate acyltransferase [Dehalococcoidales bacterium]